MVDGIVWSYMQLEEMLCSGWSTIVHEVRYLLKT
jgi:hypothetical protein